MSGCASTALAFLAAGGMALAQPPEVQIDPALEARGWYQAVPPLVRIRLEDATRCEVFVHEFVHHRQNEVGGPATTPEEVEAREREARRIENAFRERE